MLTSQPVRTARRHYFEEYVGRRLAGTSLANCTEAINSEPLLLDTPPMEWTSAETAANKDF
jgi:hypothetical protein